MTREEALTMIIASIAMEELALSHIINAEGEKLQYILGTLPGAKPCACPQDVLAVNKSVASLLDVVAQNQMLLKNKLEKVLEVCPAPVPPCGPCPPPCPPPVCPPPCRGQTPWPPPGGEEVRPKCALHLVERQAGYLWGPGCRLPWRQNGRQGEQICWNECDPTQIRLDPRAAYAVRCTLTVRAMPPARGEGAVCLRQTPCGTFAETQPLRFSLERAGDSPQTLHYAAVLHPRSGGERRRAALPGAGHQKRPVRGAGGDGCGGALAREDRKMRNNGRERAGRPGKPPTCSRRSR